MADYIHFIKKTAAVSSKALTALLSATLALSFQACDDVEVDRGEEPTPDNFFVGDNRLLTDIYDAKSYTQTFVFDYGREGLLSYIASPSYSLNVAYAPFNLYDSNDYHNGVGNNWQAFYFTDNGYVKGCTQRVSSPYSGEDYNVNYSMSYFDGRISYISVYGSGYGIERGQTWRLRSTYSFRWYRETLESIDFKREQSVSGTVVTDQDITYTFGYDNRSFVNKCYQFPMCISSIMEGFEFMPLTGLLGFGPGLLPNTVAVTRHKDLLDGEDYGSTEDVYTVSYVLNYDGTIKAEDSYVYGYN